MIGNNIGGLLEHYDGSHIKLITSHFTYNWLPWKFNSVPSNYWTLEENVKKYMNWLSEQLNIKTMEDWYKVSSKVTLPVIRCHGYR